MKKFFLMVLFFFSFQIFPDSNERFIEYLYINANTGDSSGGHSALKIGDLVYHLQYYPDEIFRIEREYWDGFYYLYGIQENRTTFVHKIQVSQATWEKVRNRLNVAFLIQTKHLDILQSLKSTKDIFEVFLSKEKKLKLKGLGYLYK